MGRETISLCIIVRDEAAALPRFLRSVEPLWDELVAVDTGSRDGTVELLEQAGARVVHEPWRDDFAYARNVSLDHARGRWILVLDPDELVSPVFVRSVRRAVEDPDVGAGLVRMRNRLAHGHVREAHLLRLFRRDPLIRFRHRIHEDVTESVAAYLARTDRQVVRLAGPVQHFGYEPGRAQVKNKKVRDLELLQQCINEDPRDIYSWYKALSLALYWGDEVLLHHLAETAFEVLEVVPPHLLAGQHFAGELVVMIARSLFEHPRHALAFVNRWMPYLHADAALFYHRGELREQLGDVDGAADDYEACLTCAQDTQNLQLASVRPALGLARLAMRRGSFSGAWPHVESALSHNERDPEALLGALFIAQQSGGSDLTERFVRSHVSAHGETPELREAVRSLVQMVGHERG